MVIFLLDEASATGKGANCVISLIDYFFDNYGIKEAYVHLHADNCSGQNKNNAMVHYLLWRIITGRHRGVTLSFMLAGHTKFAPDSMFGIFKRKFRRSKVDCQANIQDVVKAASPSGVLLSQLCGDESGDSIVPMYQWDTFLGEFFRKLPAIKPLHHIKFMDGGTVECKLLSESEPTTHHLLKCNPEEVPQQKPPVIVPPGLSEQRKAYLFKEIREFVAEDCRDLVCPNPAELIPVDTEPVVEQTPVPAARKGRPKKTPRGLGAKTKRL
jgi:hypothetical protein